MKNILIIGAGAMGAAFSIPCLDNKNNVTLCEPYNDLIVNKLIKNKNFHPALNINLSNKLIITKFTNEILNQKWDLVAIAVGSIGIDWVRENLKQLKYKTNILILTKGLKFDKNTKKLSQCLKF